MRVAVGTGDDAGVGLAVGATVGFGTGVGTGVDAGDGVRVGSNCTNTGYSEYVTLPSGATYIAVTGQLIAPPTAAVGTIPE